MVWTVLVQTILPSLFVGVLLAIFNRKQRRRDTEREEQEQAKLESETVKLELLLASAKLSYAVAMAMKRGHPNGEVEDGVRQYEKAMAAFKQFERNLVVEKTMY